MAVREEMKMKVQQASSTSSPLTLSGLYILPALSVVRIVVQELDFVATRDIAA